MSTKVKLRAIIIVDYEADPKNYKEEAALRKQKPTSEFIAESDSEIDPVEFLEVIGDRGTTTFTVIPV